MKKLLQLIINGASLVLSIIALFLGFAPLAANYTASIGGHSTTANIDNSDSLFVMLSDSESLKGVGIVIIIFLALVVVLSALVVVANLLKKSCKYEWTINAGVALLSLIAGILYFAIPAITNGSLKVGGVTINGTIGLAAGPVFAAIFALVVAAINVLPVLKALLKK